LKKYSFSVVFSVIYRRILGFAGNLNWQCGSETLSKTISQAIVERDFSINNCCIDHDNCYDKQLGREHCDDILCACIDNATKPSDICNRENSPIFCKLVRLLGEEPYRQSAKKSILLKTSKSPQLCYLMIKSLK
ncbi:unnamed protein product, partial [Dracunculus medinensis]|uniref:Phospholipase A(2) n=1 Tax=Dracunculus medinensis TaxID=318479 RepID=A0A0N4U629_DRAME